MRHIIAAGLLVAGISPVAAQTPDWAAAVKADYDRDLGQMWDWFHRSPELSMKEVKTAARMAAALKAVPGVVVTEKVGGTPQAAIDAARNGGPPVPSHHSPLFKIAPEPAIVTGAVAMTAVVLDLLPPEGPRS